TVDFIPNYDETRTEPTVFPAAFPNLLVNGGTGIAVGMATNMAPHNLGEIIDGITAQIDNPNITDVELMKLVKGPDFPTGCMVLEIRRDAIPKVVINNLYKHTSLESGFAVNALAIDHGRPKTLGLKALIACYIEHRREVIVRRTKFELRKAEERAETLEGYLIALSNLDEFIRIIRQSANREEAKIKLLAFDF